jgi:tRNA(Ile)-lysidine synthetase-like protein
MNRVATTVSVSLASSCILSSLLLLLLLVLTLHMPLSRSFTLPMPCVFGVHRARIPFAARPPRLLGLRSHPFTSPGSGNVGQVSLPHRALSLSATDTQDQDGTERKVIDFIKSTKCIQSGDHVLLSVSGGVDSMAMLHILANIFALSNSNRPVIDRAGVPENVRLSVMSFNHKFRSEADEEIEFVRKWADKYNVLFHERVLANGGDWNSAVQEKARAWRHQCYVEWASAEAKTQKLAQNRMVVATAHHNDDQIETILAKILRGSHISSYYGMHPSRKLAVRSAPLTLVRPLLASTKQELIDYMRGHNLDWREDVTNADSTKYRRNAIRHRLIPLIAEIIEDDQKSSLLRKRLHTLGEQAQNLEEFQRSQVDGLIGSHVRHNHFVRPQIYDNKGYQVFGSFTKEMLGQDSRMAGHKAVKIVQTEVADIDCKDFRQFPEFLKTTVIKRVLEKLHYIYDDGNIRDIHETTTTSNPDGHRSMKSISFDQLKLLQSLAESKVPVQRKTATITSAVRGTRVGGTFRLEVDHSVDNPAALEALSSENIHTRIIPSLVSGLRP